MLGNKYSRFYSKMIGANTNLHAFKLLAQYTYVHKAAVSDDVILRWRQFPPNYYAIHVSILVTVIKLIYM